jgi:hypothetical protein
VSAIDQAAGVTISEVINVGRELKVALEHAARQECRDVSNLARLILREWLAARQGSVVREQR